MLDDYWQMYENTHNGFIKLEGRGAWSVEGPFQDGWWGELVPIPTKGTISMNTESPTAMYTNS